MIRKLIYLVACASIMVGCTNDIAENEMIDGAESMPQLTTRVLLNNTHMRQTLSSSTYMGTTDAYFFIRIDNRIPGCGDFDAKEYYPQTARGGSMFNEKNKGSLNTDLVYKWSYGNGGIHEYIYDTSGKNTIIPLIKIPSIADLISSNEGSNIDLSQVDSDTLKVLWYITKYDWGQWHVDGVLTGQSTKDITEVPGVSKDTTLVNRNYLSGVEVDIHQQSHKDWGEIKTSVILRDTINISHVVVTIPLEKEFVAEKDDFAIRQWSDYRSYETDSTSYQVSDMTYNVKVTVTHNDSEIIYDIYCDPNYIKSYMLGNSKDGVAIEIHTYTKCGEEETKSVWGALKKSTVSPLIEDKFKISSALFK